MGKEGVEGPPMLAAVQWLQWVSGENSVRGLPGYYGRGRESQGESGDSDLGIMEICPSVRRGGDTLGDLDTHFLIKR